MNLRGKKGYSSSTMSGNKEISLTLLVDKQQNRVVLAESDKDFVDILLSFLTMPMGTILRLLKKDSSMGCIANLYESIENLDNQHFQTEVCKAMLLHPLNAADQYFENLIVNIDDTKPRNFFICDNFDCCCKATCSYSSVPNTQCCCGKQMTYCCEWENSVLNETVNGVFVKGGVKFLITDDLRIMPASTTLLLSLLGKLGKNDGSDLEERVLDLGHEEILNLLQKTLASKSPLTNLCFNSSTTRDALEPSHMDGIFELIPKSECEVDSELKEVKVKLLLTKNDNKVVHMEGGEEMADLVFSFLTYPLGSLIKLLNKNSCMGCVDNLYSSFERLCLEGNDFIKSEKCKMMLLHPKLAPYFSCKNQLLMIDEMAPRTASVRGCYGCYWLKGSGYCSHGVVTATLKGVNPKSPNNGTEPGDGYAKGPGKFILTDDFHVSPMSLISTFRAVNKLEVPFTDLVEKEISIREVQALNLLKAALVSKTALTDVFAPNIDKRRVKTV